jgi:hypothetical protein
MYICWATRELKYKTIHIFTFLETIALTKEADFHSQNQVIDKDLLRSGNNSIRGAALCALFECLEVENSVDQVFNVCEKVVSEEIYKLNVIILVHLDKLRQHNMNRMIHLFEVLVNDKTPIEVVNHSIVALQYLIHEDFQRFIPIIKRILTENEAGTQKYIVKIVANAALYHGDDNADELLDLAIQRQYSIVEEAIKYIGTAKWQKSANFIQNSFNLIKEDDKSSYSSILLFAEPAHFDRWYPILKKMLQNYPKVANEINWVEYWLKCDIRNYYKECTELLGYFYKIASYESLVRYDSEGSFIELIDKIYKQAEFHKDEDYIFKILDIYDAILKNPIIRGREKFDILNDY